jgi:signal peptidase I
MKDWLRENRGFVAFLLCFGLIRTAVADYNPIPSGSMQPNLLEGDVVLVNRLAYDVKIPFTNVAVARLGEPQRGDIVTFYSPTDGKHLIKRLVGLPGDRIEMRDKHLVINGAPASYASQAFENGALRLVENFGGADHEVQWQSVSTPVDDFGPVAIPADQYLMLGDNRDNSADSRYIGLVPRRLLIGRAHHVMVSADITGNWLPRFERFGRPLQ